MQSRRIHNDGDLSASFTKLIADAHIRLDQELADQRDPIGLAEEISTAIAARLAAILIIERQLNCTGLLLGPAENTIQQRIEDAYSMKRRRFLTSFLTSRQSIPHAFRDWYMGRVGEVTDNDEPTQVEKLTIIATQQFISHCVSFWGIRYDDVLTPGLELHQFVAELTGDDVDKRNMIIDRLRERDDQWEDIAEVVLLIEPEQIVERVVAICNMIHDDQDIALEEPPQIKIADISKEEGDVA